MTKQTYEALKRTMHRTIWIDTNALKKDVFKIMDWIDKVSEEYTEESKDTIK